MTQLIDLFLSFTYLMLQNKNSTLIVNEAISKEYMLVTQQSKNIKQLHNVLGFNASLKELNKKHQLE